MWDSKKKADQHEKIEHLTQRLANLLLNQRQWMYQKSNPSTSFYTSNKNIISQQTLLGQLIDRSDYYPSNVQLQTQACFETQGGIERKGKNTSKFWNNLERQVSKIESEKEFRPKSYYQTPQRIGIIDEEEVTGKDPYSPCGKRRYIKTVIQGQMMAHPNNTKQNYENIQRQIGMASPSLAISNGKSQANMRKISFSNAKTNSDLKLRHDALDQVISEREEYESNHNRRQYQKVKRPKNLQNIEINTAHPISNKIDSFQNIITQPSSAMRTQVPVKPRHIQDRTASIVSNTRDTQLIQAKSSRVTSQEYQDKPGVQFFDAKKLIKNGCRAAQLVLSDLFKFFTCEKQSSSYKRSISCSSKFSKGHRPHSALGGANKIKRLQMAKKVINTCLCSIKFYQYFDIDQIVQNPSSPRPISNYQFSQKNKISKQKTNIPEQRKQKNRFLPSQSNQQDYYDGLQKRDFGGQFRRTSCPPKARCNKQLISYQCALEYNKQQTQRGRNQQLNNHRIHQQYSNRQLRLNQIHPLSISHINQPFSLDQLSQQQKLSNRNTRGKPDQVQTISLQQRSEQKGEYTIPRIQYMRQLSTQSPNLHSLQKSNDLSKHQSVTRNRTPGNLMQDVQRNQQQQFQLKHKRRLSGSVSSSLGYNFVTRGNSIQGPESVVAPQTARFRGNQSRDLISPRGGDAYNKRGQINLNTPRFEQNNNMLYNNPQLYSPVSSKQSNNAYFSKAREIQIIDDEEDHDEEVKRSSSRKFSYQSGGYSYSNRIFLQKKVADLSNTNQHQKHSTNVNPSTVGQGAYLNKRYDKNQDKISKPVYTNQNKNSKSQIPLSRTIDLESFEEGSRQIQPAISVKISQKEMELSKNSKVSKVSKISKKAALKDLGSDDLTGKFSDKFITGALNDYRGVVGNLAAKNQGRGLAGILSAGKTQQNNNE